MLVRLIPVPGIRMLLRARSRQGSILKAAARRSCRSMPVEILLFSMLPICVRLIPEIFARLACDILWNFRYAKTFAASLFRSMILLCGAILCDFVRLFSVPKRFYGPRILQR